MTISTNLFPTKNKYVTISPLCQQGGSITNKQAVLYFNIFFLESSELDMSGDTLPDTKFVTTARLYHL